MNELEKPQLGGHALGIHKEPRIECEGCARGSFLASLEYVSPACKSPAAYAPSRWAAVGQPSDDVTLLPEPDYSRYDHIVGNLTGVSHEARPAAQVRHELLGHPFFVQVLAGHR